MQALVTSANVKTGQEGSGAETVKQLDHVLQLKGDAESDGHTSTCYVSDKGACVAASIFIFLASHLKHDLRHSYEKGPCLYSSFASQGVLAS